MRSRAFLIVVVASFLACAGRGKPAETPVAGERIGSGPLAQAEMRRWLRPLRTLDASACPPSRDDSAAFHDCWCRLVCGVRFEARPATTQIRYPYAEVDGPGFEVAPDGHVTACWHSGLGARETHVTCASR